MGRMPIFLFLFIECPFKNKFPLLRSSALDLLFPAYHLQLADSVSLSSFLWYYIFTLPLSIPLSGRIFSPILLPFILILFAWFLMLNLLNPLNSVTDNFLHGIRAFKKWGGLLLLMLTLLLCSRNRIHTINSVFKSSFTQ